MRLGEAKKPARLIVRGFGCGGGGGVGGGGVHNTVT